MPSPPSPPPPPPPPQRHQRVRSDYGEGVVLAYRPADSMVLVDLARYGGDEGGNNRTAAPILLYARRERLEVLVRNKEKNGENESDGDDATAATSTTTSRSNRSSAPVSRSSSSSSASMTGTAPASPPTNAIATATTTTATNATTATATATTATTTATATAALLQDERGNPLFPRLYLLRREGQKVSQQLAASVVAGTSTSTNQQQDGSVDSAMTATPASPPTNAATATTATTTTATATAAAALLQDERGNPLFPRLHRLRREGQKVSQQLAASVAANTNQDSVEAWKQASQQAVSAAHTNLKQLTHSLSLNGSTTSQQQQNDDNTVRTPFGTGRLVERQYPSSGEDATAATTATYVVQLPFGTLYTKQEPIKCAKKSNKRKKKRPAPTALELNETFLQWEEARQRELEAECRRLGIPHDDDGDNHPKCFACLREQQSAPTKKQQPPAALYSANNTNAGRAFIANADGTPLFPRLYQWRQSSQELVSKGGRAVAASAANAVNGGAEAQACLLCGTPTCARHCHAGFRREGVPVCADCLRHLEEYDQHVATTSAAATTTTTTTTSTLPQEWTQQHTHHLCDLYGRALLLLQYCAQFLPDTARQLERAARQHNEIAGVGGSSAGLASGIMGVAAACAILTPAGPPLLVGSLLLGGSATAVQAGGSALRYYSEPNQLANRVLTLQGICDRILEIVDAMRDTTLVPYLEGAISKLEREEEKRQRASEAAVAGNQPASDDRAPVAVRAGARMGGTAATSAAGLAATAAQEGALAGRFASRATTAAARTVRFARFAGGALSAATVLLEARQLSQTLEQIERGSPCEKAQAVRRVHARLHQLPSKIKVESVCQSYMKVRTKELFQQSMMGSAVLLSEEYQAVDDLTLVEQVASSLEDGTGGSSQDDNSSITSDLSSNDGGGFASPPPPTSTTSNTDNTSSKPSLSSKSSLLRRVQRYKERTSALAAAAPPSIDVAASLCV